MITLAANLYLTADRTRLVPEGDPAAAYLWAAAGRRITEAEAAQWGITPPAAPEPKAVEFPPANKMLPGPPATRQRSGPPRRKGH